MVHYWAAVVPAARASSLHEIDEVAWVDVRTANDRLDYARDREQLLALVRAERADELDTWPLALVRHAKATPRSKWKGDDRRRPLDAVGRAQATSVAAVLGAYGVTRVVSSSSVRCSATVEPYAAARVCACAPVTALSEEGFAESPDEAGRELDRLLPRASRPHCAATARCCRPCSSRSPAAGPGAPEAEHPPARGAPLSHAQGRGAGLPRARPG